MKLLISIHSLESGGAERVTVNLANYWAEKGWAITIITMSDLGKDFYALHPDIRRIAMELDKNSTNILMAIKYNFRRIKVLRTMLIDENPDLALGMMCTANCLLSMAAKGTGIPAIGSERVYPPKVPVGRVWSWLRRRTYPNFSAVVAQTEESAHWLRSNAGVNLAPVIPNPVFYPLTNHEPRLRPVQVMNASQDCHMLLAVGRLVPQKGFDVLLTAFSELSMRFPSWYLVILGEGDDRSVLGMQLSELGLEDQVFLPGAVGNIGEWYDVADIYVLTSLFEGFPNTLVEALAYGLPAVSVDCETGPRDILRHEIDGLLVDQGDHAALVEALARLMSDEELRARFGARAVEIRERFSIDTITSMLEALFSDLIKKEKA